MLSLPMQKNLHLAQNGQLILEHLQMQKDKNAAPPQVPTNPEDDRPVIPYGEH